MVDPDAEVTYNGELMKLRDVPDPVVKHLCGLGHSAYDCKMREHHPGEWPCIPEECRYADETQGIWINEGENLVCQGCGLDFT